MTNVLGLDLSITGTGICEPVAGATTTIHPWSKGDDRLVEIRNLIVAHLRPHVDLAVIEGPVLRSQSALPLAMLHGAVRVALISNKTPYLLVAPATLKVYATGRGNAQKPDMRMELFKRTGLDLADDNQVDAKWLWALGHDLAGTPVIDLPKTHRRALDKLALPKGYS